MSGRIAVIVWALGSAVLAAALAVRLDDGDRGVFLPGATTHGHYQIELACDACHKPFQGEEALDAACRHCHAAELEIAEDSHPKKKFTDPRNADRVAALDARSCIACHVEHRPELTGEMGLTLPVDYCRQCHADIADERPSHKGMEFKTCASAGCHNFHDNRALYEDFLIKHAAEPDLFSTPLTPLRTKIDAAGGSLGASDADAETAAELLAEWAPSSHARAGVNCSDCHLVAENDDAPLRWRDESGYQACRSCHEHESEGFLAGKHGMRLAAGLSPMSPAMARLPMQPTAHDRELSCGACHGAHDFDVRRAAAVACLECHADPHSLSYETSPHSRLWEREIAGQGAAGSGVSCATCHLPRLEHGEAGASNVRIEHNQNANLRPNEKMIRDVCLRCHGLGFSLDALADPALIESNFRGRPSRRVESIDMARRRSQ